MNKSSKSVGEYNPTKAKLNRNTLIRLIATIILAATAIASINYAYKKIDENSLKRDLNENIGIMTLDDKDSPFKDIVGRNTYRNDSGNIYYDNVRIGQELAKLDFSFRDAGIYSVLNRMGENAYNKVGHRGQANIDEVIFNMGLETNTLNEYLTKMGYVDEFGNPSVDKFNQITEEHLKELVENSEKEIGEKNVGSK